MLPKLTKLDNDDVADQERKDAEAQLDGKQAVLPDQKPITASSAAPTPNPVLEQVFKPAELQAALEPTPLVSFVAVQELQSRAFVCIECYRMLERS